MWLVVKLLIIWDFSHCAEPRAVGAAHQDDEQTQAREVCAIITRFPRQHPEACRRFVPCRTLT